MFVGVSRWFSVCVCSLEYLRAKYATERCSHMCKCNTFMFVRG